jgi:hypothetical protein
MGVATLVSYRETLNKFSIVIASVLAFSREAAGRGGKQSKIPIKLCGFGSPRRFAPRDDELKQYFLRYSDDPSAGITNILANKAAFAKAFRSLSGRTRR